MWVNTYASYDCAAELMAKILDFKETKDQKTSIVEMCIIGYGIMDYPIATFLFWHIDDDNVSWDTYFCNFLQEIT